MPCPRPSKLSDIDGAQAANQALIQAQPCLAIKSIDPKTSCILSLLNPISALLAKRNSCP